MTSVAYWGLVNNIDPHLRQHISGMNHAQRWPVGFCRRSQIYIFLFFFVYVIYMLLFLLFFFKHHSAWRSPRIAGPPSEEALQPSPRSPRERGASDSRLGKKTVESGGILTTWVWVNTYRYIFSGMNIHLPAILM